MTKSELAQTMGVDLQQCPDGIGEGASGGRPNSQSWPTCLAAIDELYGRTGPQTKLFGLMQAYHTEGSHVRTIRRISRHPPEAGYTRKRQPSGWAYLSRVSGL